MRCGIVGDGGGAGNDCTGATDCGLSTDGGESGERGGAPVDVAALMMRRQDAAGGGGVGVDVGGVGDGDDGFFVDATE